MHFHPLYEVEDWENEQEEHIIDHSYWMWRNELWWKELGQDGDTPCTPPVNNCLPSEMKSYSGWGFVWLRPQLDENPDPVVGRPIDEANHYFTFRIMEPYYSIELDMSGDFDGWDTVMPVRDQGFDLVDPAMSGSDELLLGWDEIALSAAPTNAAGELGRYAYEEGLAGDDSAVAGLVHILVDRGTFEMVNLGYAVGDAPGSVPATTDFASARFGWPAAAKDGAGDEDGLAVFGGRLADGSSTNRIWIGRFGGVDKDGVPYWSWRDASPYGAEMPTPRADAVLVPDRENHRLLLLGGRNGARVLDDLWAYDLQRGMWNMLDSDFIDVVVAEAAQFRGWTYLAGGERGDGSANSTIGRFHVDDPVLEHVADQTTGPGARTSPALGFAALGAGVLMTYGGVDAAGAQHNDLWAVEASTGEWHQLAVDCTDASCPGPSPSSFIVVGETGTDVGLYATADENGHMFYKHTAGGDGWVGSRDLRRPRSPAVDCDGDGVPEPETVKACTATNEWYAEVGRFSCPPRGGGEPVCSAREPATMSRIASWSPDGWEWIVDFAATADDYSYVLADGTLYTFDLAVIGGPDLSPTDADELESPGSCWWCGADWGISLATDGEVLYVGATSGLHVFSLADPGDPVEVGYLATRGPVRDVAASGDLLYLADALGVTVVDVTDHELPLELEHVRAGLPVKRVGLGGGDLMVLTSFDLRKYACCVARPTA